MIATFLILLAALTLSFLAGMRCATVIRQQRALRRGGMVDLTGIEL